MLDVSFFDELRIGLATADDITQLVLRRGQEAGDHQLPHAEAGEGRPVLREDLRTDSRLGVLLRQVQARRFKGIICERCGVEVTRAKVRRERMRAHPDMPPSRTSGTSRACRRGWATCSTWRRRILEKIIYFAAYVITEVDDEMRHNELSTLRGEMVVERKAVEDQRDAELEARAQKLEADLAELEAEGAKSDVRRKVA